MANGHRELAEESSSSPIFVPPPDDHYGNEHATRRLRLALPHPVPQRFPGDGLDFRRPMSGQGSVTSAVPVIDLTDDNAEPQDAEATTHSTSAETTAGSSRAQRLPRYDRNIIDIDLEDEEDRDTTRPTQANLFHSIPRARPQFSGLRRPARPPSPPREMDDVEFLEEHPLSRPQTVSRQASPVMRAPRSVTPYPGGFGDAIDLTADDDVVLLDARAREGINGLRPGMTAELGTRSAAERGFGSMGHIADLWRDGAIGGGRLMQRLGAIAGFEGQVRAHQQQTLEHLRHIHENRNHRGVHLRAVRRPPPTNMPGMMDYDTIGFDMGLPGGNRPPTPKYSPPPEPEPGFTRNPEEDEAVVCPNCGDELAMGDSELKQQVWVVKKCGHAYCGECAENRTRKDSKKGKAKATDATLPAPFKTCVVEGCGKPAARNSMIHIYLGS